MIYSDIIDLIKKCEGQFLTIVKDYNKLNILALNSIKKSLSSEYKILECHYSENRILYEICNVKDKTVLFVNCGDDRISKRIIHNNDNLIIIFIKRYYNMYNNIMPTNDITALYLSAVVFVFANKIISIEKSRYSNVDTKMNMTQFSRKSKLEYLNKISK